MGKWDEICYPFMPEDSIFCDHEILCDGLSSYLALTLSIAEERDYPERLQQDLLWLCEMALHVNGSVRGKLAIFKEDLDKLYELYDYYKSEVKVSGFTLPTGSYLASQINIARYKSKEVVRLLNKINKNEKKIEDILFSFTNLMANLLYVMSCYVNKLDKKENKEFISKSY
ncbi:hypothetical protein GOQ27_11225 [Clostridium sp. D2Q-11]|uniref:Cobalamin adenosyltransferase-like domain-containing protein n=1 Tax=Anaeromonas frigoriresistens TaxID=2683708 RepID=A0A942UXZ4_9FIRM|nr:ATP:cob(I)alamin adenosyltransferase [Anaeromonas frigoriresistens]MBS4539036.1 hypothetical protein [Anaeromonas frigoriresistens]